MNEIFSTNLAKVTAQLVQLDPENRNQLMGQIQELFKNYTPTLEEMKKLWKGLFYALWSSDKVVNQTALSKAISELIHHFGNKNQSGQYVWVEAAIFILNKEWNKVDYLRINQFLSLARFVFTEILVEIGQKDWKLAICRQYYDLIYQILYTDENAEMNGLGLHLIQIFLETVNNFKIQKTQKFLNTLLIFNNILLNSPSKAIRQAIRENIYQKLIAMKKEQKLKAIKFPKIKDYLFNEAKKESVNAPNRQDIYEIIELINENMDESEFIQENHQIQPLNNEQPTQNLKRQAKSNDEITNKSKQEEPQVQKVEQLEKKQKTEKNKKQKAPKTKEQQVQKKPEKANEKQKQIQVEPTLKDLDKFDEDNYDEEQDEDFNSDDIDPEDLKNFSQSRSLADILSSIINPKQKNKKAQNGTLDEDDQDDEDDDYENEDDDDDDGFVSLEQFEKSLDDQDDQDDMNDVADDMDPDTFDLIDDIDEGQDQEMDENDFEGLNISQVWNDQKKMATLKNYYESLPKYLFLTPKQKEKYFNELNKEYLTQIDKESNTNTPDHTKKVQFVAQNNHVQEFDLNQKVIEITKCDQNSTSNQQNSQNQTQGAQKSLIKKKNQV